MAFEWPICSCLLMICLGFLLVAPQTSAGEQASPPPYYTIPIVDVSHDVQRQVVVDREPGQYLGHPTTVLLEDNKTMICVYPKGHGRGAIVMKRSEDAGRTWSERLPVPESWRTSLEVPTIHRVIDAEGHKRLILFSGLYPIRMAVSEDDGKTWSELEPIGNFGGIVTMSSMLELNRKGHYLAFFHDDGRFIRGGDVERYFMKSPHSDRVSPASKPWRFWVYTTLSQDGGLTWSVPAPIASLPDADLCEPGALRSPDGSQIAVLFRENSRKSNGFVIFSDDEGLSWSEPVELPASLTGDRHTAKYAPDGRLVIVFRDTTLVSPTWGDFVGWVGTYDDIVNGREGQYRLRLLDNTKGADTSYPGLEVLPDGTFISTTYGHWVKGEEPYIMSVRFTLDEIDDKAKQWPKQTPLFVSGEDGYDTYRIPSLIVTSKGTVLAFCEGRKAGRGDTGDIDLLLKRSEDNGETWSDQQVVWDDGPNTCGNPCPVVDETTGTIWLLMTHNLGQDRESEIVEGKSEGTRTVWVSYSDDDGLTWAPPKNITPTTKKENWTWYATGPGVGIQLRLGDHQGRLIIPCDHIVAGTKTYHSHVIYSDDHGQSWQLGGTTAKTVNECQVIERTDGELLLNMRRWHTNDMPGRAIATSPDGGETWSDLSSDPVLIEPRCQASLIRYAPSDAEGPPLVLFSNPADTKDRYKIVVRLSTDDGRTWPTWKSLFPGPAAYSCLTVLKDGTMACLYERGAESPYDEIAFAAFSLEWLGEGVLD